MSTARRINLEDFRGVAGNRILAGRDLGKEARERARLDELDSKPDEVEVFVPKDFFSVSSSWLLGAFGPSISKLGETAFRQKYLFTGKGIAHSLADAIAAVKLTRPLR